MLWEPKSCCCATPKVGTLVLGWLGVISSVLNLVGLIRFVDLSRADVVDVCNNITKNMDEYRHMWIQTHVDTDTCVNIVYGSIGVTAAISVLGATICGLLLWGVNKYKPTMMLPYMIVKVIGIFLAILFGLIVTGLLIYVQQFLALLFFIVIYGLVLFLDVYLFLVVRVCYKEVKQHSSAMGGGTDILYVEQKDALYPYKM